MKIGLWSDSHNFPNLPIMKLSAYVMIYQKATCDKKHRELQRWVNCKFIFRSVKRFEDYKPNKNNGTGRSYCF